MLVVATWVTRQQLQDLRVPRGVGRVRAAASAGVKLAQVVQREDLCVCVQASLCPGYVCVGAGERKFWI